jgi:cell surface protein SprA
VCKFKTLFIDRYTGSIREWKPDGKFDWMQNRTIIPETGDIIFPTLYPFRDEIRKYVTDTNLIFREIYTQRKFFAQISIQANYYYLKGNIDTLK